MSALNERLLNRINELRESTTVDVFKNETKKEFLIPDDLVKNVFDYANNKTSEIIKIIQTYCDLLEIYFLFIPQTHFDDREEFAKYYANLLNNLVSTPNGKEISKKLTEEILFEFLNPLNLELKAFIHDSLREYYL